MKKLYSLVLFLAVSLCTIAQAPESFNYQAIVRDGGGQEITNTTVGIQISLLQTSAAGTAVYVERFTPTTNDFGLITLDIGTGDVQSGVFADIDWASDSYFIKVEMDENGLTDYVHIGTSQLLSVPYALHASTAGQLSIGDTWLKNGSELYYNDGNVGIGIDDPLQKLHLRGNGSYTGTDIVVDGNDRTSLLITGSFPNIIMGSNGNDNHGATLGFWNFNNDATTFQWNLGGGQDGNFSIGFSKNSSNPHCGVDGFTESCTDALTPILIDTLGHVGINNTNPDYDLDVNGDVHLTGDLIVDGVIEGPQYIEIHSSGGPNLSASGIISYGTVDVNTIGISAALYMAAGGNYEEADADFVSTMPCVALAIETETGDKDILLQGYIRNDIWTFIIGAPVYVSPTAGVLTQTIPTATGQQVQVVGYATASNIIYFSPDLTLIELK